MDSPAFSKRQWSFDEEIATIFEEYVRKNVPFYDEVHRMMAEISDWFLNNGSVVYDLGTSTGESILRIYGRDPSRKLNFVAVDSSREMIEKAKARLDHVPSVQFLLHDLNKPLPLENASLVSAVLVFQFLEPAARPRLMREVYKGLNAGRALLLVEKIMGKTAQFDSMWIDLYHDMKRRNGMREKEIYDKSLSLRGVMRPYSLAENIRTIREAGFRTFDVFFKWYNWAGILAIK